MGFRIIRSDITKVRADAIVNPANPEVAVGTGCDSAVYEAAGYEELLEYRRKNIGAVDEGHAFITPAFNLKAAYIIHAVSPRYINGSVGEEDKLRNCYRESLKLASKNGVKTIAFPLLATGSYGYPLYEGLSIALEEIRDFLEGNDMEITLVVFGERATSLGHEIYPELEEYISRKYVDEAVAREYGASLNRCSMPGTRSEEKRSSMFFGAKSAPLFEEQDDRCELFSEEITSSYDLTDEDYEAIDKGLKERIAHMSDTFGEYLLYLISKKGFDNPDVYKRSLVDKKTFSKIKNNPDYHPDKTTALCLCMGARLNLDEAKDLLARAGYALSPSDKRDIIFSFFIEKKIYDLMEVDIWLEENGLASLVE